MASRFSLASSGETSLYRILYSTDRRAMVRLLASVLYFRVESILVTLSLRSKRFITQSAAHSLDHLNRVCVFSCMWIPHR